MRGRPAPIGLSLPTLNAQLSQIIVGAGSDISSPNEHVVSFLTSAVLQYVESVANLALDFAAQSGTDATAESVSTVIRDNFQLAQSAALVTNWRRLRTMTRIDPCKATMEGYPTTILSVEVLPTCPMKLNLLEKEAFEVAALSYIPSTQPVLPPTVGTGKAVGQPYVSVLL